MFKNQNDFFDYINNKSISVIGMGISHRPLIELLISKGAKVTVYDKKTSDILGDAYLKYKKMGANFCLGDSYLDCIEGDLIFKTPGIRHDNPGIIKAVKNGSVLTSEMEVFFEICPAPIIAVTGSDGKTTTTTLISEILKMSGKNLFLGGNIGTPLLPIVEQIKKDDVVVVELSSFQLQTMKKSPHVAIVTNISPNHLDYHKSYEEYIEAKKNIFVNQSINDLLIINAENAVTNGFEEEAKGKVLKFSSANSVKNGCSLINGKICYCQDGNLLELFDASKIILPGRHNIENYLAAICATKDFVNVSDVLNVAQNFRGVPHRIEFVRSINGVNFYNSSIDSSPKRSIATLSVFENKVIMICGGKDKGIPYDELGPEILKKVKHLILIGATADKIKCSVNKAINSLGTPPDFTLEKAETYEEAVIKAFDCSESGDNVILSPASTSFDMFENFEERGNLFKKLVLELR